MRYIRLTAVLLLAACESPTTGKLHGAPSFATSITLSATSLSFSSLGATEQLTATVKDQNGATMSGASVTWSSSSASVATVSSSGLVTAVANGTTTITATSGMANTGVDVTVELTTWASVRTSSRHTCGLTTSAEAYCWGDNTQGQIGNGTTIDSHEPQIATPTKVNRPWQ